MTDAPDKSVLDGILSNAAKGVFNENLIKRNLAQLKNHVDDTGSSLLHYAARVDRDDIIKICLDSGFSPHKINNSNKTPFNEAATNSPKSGRLMTLHWFNEAMDNKKPDLNEGSGYYRTPIAQYMAKWCSLPEIQHMMSRAKTLGKEVDFFVHGDTNWTPLHGASVMIGREKVVEFLADMYLKNNPKFLLIETSKNPFETDYIHDEKPYHVSYETGCTADKLPKIRVGQDTGLNHEEKEELEKNATVIKNAIKAAEQKIYRLENSKATAYLKETEKFRARETPYYPVQR